MSSQVTSREAFSFGWNKFKENPGFYIMAILVASFASSLVQALGNSLEKLQPLPFLFQIAGIAVSFFLNFGVIVIALKSVRGKAVDFPDLLAAKEDYPLLWQYALGNIFYGLLVAVGMIALIIPGLYFALKYWLVPYFVVDKKVGFSEAFHMSAEATEGKKLFVFGFLLLAGLVNLLGVLALGIGFLVSLPVTTLAMAYLYTKLAKDVKEA